MIRPHESLKDGLHTDIVTSSVVAATESPRHVIRERDGVSAKAVSGKPWSNTSRVDAPARHPAHSADGIWCIKAGVGWSTAGVQGDLAAALREAEVQLAFAFAFALGVGRPPVVPPVEESPGVERRELDCGRGAREELVARGVEVDAERELLDPLRYGEDRDSERDAWVRLLAENGGNQGTVVASRKGYATW